MTIKTGILHVLSLLLLFTLPLLVFSFNAKNTLLNPDFYDKVLQENKFYENLSQNIALFFGDSLGGDGQYFSRAEANAMMQKALPYSAVKKQMKQNMGNLVSFLKGETDSFQMQLDLREAKTIVESESAARLGRRAENESVDAGAVAHSIAERIPDKLDFSQGLNSPVLMDRISEARIFVKIFLFAAEILAIAVAALIVLIIVVARDLKLAARRIGYPFFVTGIFSFASSSLLPLAMDKALGALPQFALGTGVQGVAASFLKGFLEPVKTQALALLVVGAVLLVFSFLYKRENAPEQPAAEERKKEKRE